MLDLSTIPPTVLLARGSYSTVNGEYKTAIDSLRLLCEKLQSIPPQIMRQIPAFGPAESEGIKELVALANGTAAMIAETAELIASLSRQKEDLKPLAWPK